MLKAHATFSEPPPVLDPSTWSAFWRDLKHVFRAWGFRPGTRRLYRAVLRGLARTSGRPSSQLEPRHLDAYLKHLEGRAIPLPEGLLPIVRAGLERCGPAELVFPGRYPGAALSQRTIHRVVQAIFTLDSQAGLRILRANMNACLSIRPKQKEQTIAVRAESDRKTGLSAVHR